MYIQDASGLKEVEAKLKLHLRYGRRKNFLSLRTVSLAVASALCHEIRDIYRPDNRSVKQVV